MSDSHNIQPLAARGRPSRQQGPFRSNASTRRAFLALVGNPVS
ncbi:hypothetical protein [Pelagibius sp.]